MLQMSKNRLKIAFKLIGVAFLILGIIARRMHWEGAAVFLIVAIAFEVVGFFLPPSEETKEKATDEVLDDIE